MKRTSILLLLAGVLFTFASCQKEPASAGKTDIVDFPVIALEGESSMVISLGDTFVEPGYSCSDKGVDVTSDVEVMIVDVDGNPCDEIETAAPGVYTITYYAVGQDGFDIQTSRTVYVCDPTITTDLSGTYKTVDGTYRNSDGTITNFPGFEIKLKKVCPGFFTIDDMLGKYYEEYVGYGPAYNYSYDFSADAYLSLDSSNVLSMVSGGYVGAWGDKAENFADGKYDPATKTISFSIEYAGMMFYIVAVKQ